MELISPWRVFVVFAIMSCVWIASVFTASLSLPEGSKLITLSGRSAKPQVMWKQEVQTLSVQTAKLQLDWKEQVHTLSILTVTDEATYDFVPSRSSWWLGKRGVGGQGDSMYKYMLIRTYLSRLRWGIAPDCRSPVWFCRRWGRDPCCASQWLGPRSPPSVSSPPPSTSLQAHTCNAV